MRELGKLNEVLNESMNSSERAWRRKEEEVKVESDENRRKGKRRIMEDSLASDSAFRLIPCTSNTAFSPGLSSSRRLGVQLVP
jgi:hypothetical protein